MTEWIHVVFVGLFFSLLAGLVLAIARFALPSWWRLRRLRWAFYFLPLLGWCGMAIWTVGVVIFNPLFIKIGTMIAAVATVLALALILSLPLSAMLLALTEFIRDKFTPHPAPALSRLPDADDLSRRRFMQKLAGAIPVTTLGTGSVGIIRSLYPVRVYRRELTIPGLPSELDGFSIFHISDIHLGYYITMETVEQILIDGEAYRPDMVCATGDLCDRLDVYPEVLDLLSQFRAPSGVYATLGNHEYIRGIRTVLRAFDRGGIPLLINDGYSLRTSGGARIYLAGLDDPRHMRVEEGFFEPALDQALRRRTSEAVTILMSHRPTVFDLAAMRDVMVTLAGHTHGGQIGIGDRSVFEPWYPGGYLWGEYRIGDRLLYTSAGAGHWFPFRLGCSTEAPILVLRSA